MKKKTITLLSLAVFSGLLFTLAWPERGFPGFLFIAFVPLFFIEEYISRNRDTYSLFHLLLFGYLAFFIFNLLTTWWICNSTFMGAVMAVGINSLFLSIVFQVFSWTKRYLPSRFAGYLALISFWIAFEYLHLNWILTWPWLNMGNGFASYYTWVQWYEYTGTLGGTLWVLVSNILLYEAMKGYGMRDAGCGMQDAGCRFWILIGAAVLWIGLPIAGSYVIYYRYTEKEDPVSFVVVQPNVDPYSEQYSLLPKQVIGRIMDLAQPLLDSNTNFLVAPESAIQESMWENDITSFRSLLFIREVIDVYPHLNILIGGSTFKAYENSDDITRTARKFSHSEGYYDAYNTAILINAADSLQLYHKSKLTPGVEALPSFRGFKWLEEFALDLGGTVGSLGTDDYRKVFTCNQSVSVSPAICYESAFGEFFGEFVRNGAKIMIIITNDGWWGNTPGHRQHMAFAHLRAIETRRSIARSANTGISAFIDQRGDVTEETPYWIPIAIKGTLNANDKITFYVQHGDYIARTAAWLTGILLLIALSFRIFPRGKNALTQRPRSIQPATNNEP